MNDRGLVGETLERRNPFFGPWDWLEPTESEPKSNVVANVRDWILTTGCGCQRFGDSFSIGCAGISTK